ncbi:hypothetical protein ACFLWM_00710 [Chloroflexota bacterium]
MDFTLGVIIREDELDRALDVMLSVMKEVKPVKLLGYHDSYNSIIRKFCPQTEAI